MRSRLHRQETVSDLRPRPVVLAVLAAVLMSACGGGSVRLRDVGDAVGSALADVVRDTVAPQALQPGVAPAATRPEVQVERLLARGNVRGDELLAEMLAVRQAVTAERSTRAMGQFFGSGATGGKVDPQAALRGRAAEAAMSVALSVGRQALMTYSMRQLDSHLLTITGDAEALRRETVQLPDPRELTPQGRQRAVTMGALVVMLRLSNQTLERARKDFEGLETEYARLIDRREKAAQVLYQVLARGSAGRGELQRSGLSAQDLNFIDTQLARMPLAEFVKDLGAQNLALAHLARADPAAFAQYRADSQLVVGRTQGALRLLGGATAFGAVLAIFVEQVASMARSNQAYELIPMLPLLAEFTQQSLPTLKAAAQASGAGLFSVAASGRVFRVIDEAGTGVDLSSAKDVYAELRKRKADEVLRQALFRNGASGLLHRLYLCSPPEAGRLLDAALPASERSSFARSYLARDGSSFSFANSFDNPPAAVPERERDLGDELLRADHRERTTQDRMAFVPLQQAVAAGGFERWDNDQLMRLIFSNREGLAQHATLELGSTRLRPIATPQAVYAYESLVDQCRGLVTTPAARPSTAPAATGARTAPTPPSQGRTPPPARPTPPPPR